MTDDLKVYIKQWLVKANEDVRAAKELFENDNPLCGVICFHCQQAIEKFLKAFLIFNGWQLVKTHNIDLLLDEAKKRDNNFIEINLLNISQYAKKVRYPDDFDVPSIPETKRFIEIVHEVKELVEEKIKF